jgi:hypothetical protein
MDTRKLLNDVILHHKQGKSILDGMGIDGVTYEEEYYYDLTALAGKGDIMAAEFLSIDSIQQLLIGQIEEDLFLDGKTDCQYELAASNGSKYGGLCMLLCGKYSNDQSLINQYAQYASVEEEFGYCKAPPAQIETQISSPVQSVPVSSTPYHLALGKERLGEHTLEQIKQKLEQGTLDLASKAWQQGWPEWKLISEVPEITSILASQPPPLPDDGPPPL